MPGSLSLIVEKVQVDASSGSAQFSIGDNGTLAYMSGGGAGSAQVVWIDRTGKRTPVDSAWRGQFADVALSPDNSQLAIAVLGSDGEQIWVKRLPDGPLSRLTFTTGGSSRPVWAPDGRRVTGHRLPGRGPQARPQGGAQGPEARAGRRARRRAVRAGDHHHRGAAAPAHPAAVRLRHADEFLFYVMPFIDGETLRGKLDRETQLGIDEAVKIASGRGRRPATTPTGTASSTATSSPRTSCSTTAARWWPTSASPWR